MLMELPDELSDSGMESLTASKDDTPERRPVNIFIPPVVVGTSPTAGNSPDVGNSPVAAKPPVAGNSPDAGNAPVASYSPFTTLKEYDDEPDETLSERLWGLTEMFPECVRNSTYTVTTKSWSGIKNLYQLSRTVMWVVASSSVILFAPVIFEVERAQVEEIQKSQQKQVLLGTNAAMAVPTPGMPPMPR